MTAAPAKAPARVHNFLARLGLDNDADARAIRRAYARLVKQIDQQSEADVFQDLREAYDAALLWAAHRVRLQEEREPEAVQEAEPPPPAPATAVEDPIVAADPDRLAREAFARFGAAAHALTQGGTPRDDTAWRNALRRELDDDAFMNVTARTSFEARVVHLLAGAWRAGHDALFAAACAVFGWQDERRRLLQFGYAGARLDRAIVEDGMFTAQPADELAMQREILARLSQAAAPDSEQVVGRLACLDRLLERFPTLMALTVDPDMVRQWRKLRPPAPPRGKPFDIDDIAKPVPSARRGFNPLQKRWLAIGLVMLSLVLALVASDRQPPAAPAYTSTSATLAGESDYRKAPPGKQTGFVPATGAGSLPPYGPFNSVQALHQALTRAQLDEIGSRIDYQWPAGRGPEIRSVVFAVQLAPGGEIDTVRVASGSGDAVLDKAVAKAILESAPFPSATARQLRLWYTAYVAEPAQARRGESTPNRAPPR